MSLVMGLIAGLAFGLASAFATRPWGTLLAVAPVFVWFIVFAVSLEGGLVGSETEMLGFGLCGVLLGLFLGQLPDRQRSNARLTRR
ncbi:hypothetical protein [Paeniglutamicibacter sp. NPDC091659]|uniref:hypothetical protein n=1 Tax=Paeniglutamicibacter sp. NPDC091659 TaxID=3364389 RepID=UPI00381587C7